MDEKSQIVDYPTWRNTQQIPVALPTFIRKPIAFSISEQAYEGLLDIAFQLVGKQNGKHRPISQLLEAIGLHQLSIIKPINITHTESDNPLTTEECYQAGKDDAIEKRPYSFELIYGKMPREFSEAYRRGYLEMSGKN